MKYDKFCTSYITYETSVRKRYVRINYINCKRVGSHFIYNDKNVWRTSINTVLYFDTIEKAMLAL